MQLTLPQCEGDIVEMNRLSQTDSVTHGHDQCDARTADYLPAAQHHRLV